MIVICKDDELLIAVDPSSDTAALERLYLSQFGGATVRCEGFDVNANERLVIKKDYVNED